MGNGTKRHTGGIFIHARTMFRETAWQPRADVWSTPQGWLIKFDIAGVRREDLELLLSEGRLIVRGVRRDLSLEEGRRPHLVEIPYSRFERVIEVPCRSTSEIEVRFEEGMLLVRIHTEVRR